MRSGRRATRVEPSRPPREGGAWDGQGDNDRGEDLHQGDEVAWSSHGSETTGEVEKKITERTRRPAHVAASEEEPQYEVRSEKSGKPAVHKPSALRKKK
ncbi:hypothetical protein GCM10023238_39460 [Streptomyces heliomycini]